MGTLKDTDAPLRVPNVHGIYLFIPPSFISITNDDLELVNNIDGVQSIKAGYRIDKNRRSVVYVPPRPLFKAWTARVAWTACEVIALREKLDSAVLSKVLSKEEVEEAIMRKVAAWGVWEAGFEHKWADRFLEMRQVVEAGR